MTEKELRKMNRYQLLELLIMQTERADQLQKRLEEAEKELKEQSLRLSELGSIAEASLQLSGVFEAAQAAADLYLYEAKQRADKEAANIVRYAVQKAKEILEYDKGDVNEVLYRGSRKEAGTDTSGDGYSEERIKT